MLITIPNVLTPDQVAHGCQSLDSVDKVDGKVVCHGELVLNGLTSVVCCAGMAALKELVEPIPVHGGFKYHVRAGPELDHDGEVML